MFDNRNPRHVDETYKFADADNIVSGVIARVWGREYYFSARSTDAEIDAQNFIDKFLKKLPVQNREMFNDVRVEAASTGEYANKGNYARLVKLTFAQDKEMRHVCANSRDSDAVRIYSSVNVARQEASSSNDAPSRPSSPRQPGS